MPKGSVTRLKTRTADRFIPPHFGILMAIREQRLQRQNMEANNQIDMMVDINNNVVASIDMQQLAEEQRRDRNNQNDVDAATGGIRNLELQVSLPPSGKGNDSDDAVADEAAAGTSKIENMAKDKQQQTDDTKAKPA